MTAALTDSPRRAEPSKAAPHRGFDLSSVAPVPFGRTVLTELRKLINTRGGRGLMITIAALTIAVMIGFVSLQSALQVSSTFASYFGTTAFSTALLLPVLAMVQVTSEWSQRTAMTTFALEPSRLRVLAGKYVAGLIAVAVAFLATTAFAALVHTVQSAVSGQTPVFDLGAAAFGGFLAGQVLIFTAGFALAALIGNLVVSVLIFFVLELVGWTTLPLAGALDWFAPIEPWINFGNARAPLLDGQLFAGQLSGSAAVEAWGHLASATALWVIIPLIIGAVRFVRREAK